MIPSKSKQLYAKAIMNGLGHLDDDLILEARENEPTSAESTAFHVKKYVIAAAAFILIVGSLFLFPYLAGNKRSNVLPTGWNASDQIEIKTALNPTERAGDYRLTFSNLDGVSVFYFRPAALPTGCRVLLNGETPAMNDGYYVVDLSAFPQGTSSVEVLLSGITEQEAEEIEIFIRLSDSKTTKSSHPALEG